MTTALESFRNPPVVSEEEIQPLDLPDPMCNPLVDDIVGNYAYFNHLCIAGNIVAGGGSIIGTNSFSLYEYNRGPTDYARLLITVPPGGPYTIQTDAQPVGVPTNRDLVISATDDIQINAANHLEFSGISAIALATTGGSSYIQLEVPSNGTIQFYIGGATALVLDNTFALAPLTSSIWDLGKPTQAFRNIFVGTSLQFPSQSALRSGTGVPAAGLGNDGDYYFRFDGTGGVGNTHIYFKTAGAWSSIA